MKTLTEFSGFVLKEALAKKTALLAEGKTEEEVQTAINEQLKLDETKVGFYKNVLDMTSSRLDRVKRVVVALRATETEKVPESYIEREGHFYLVEYFASADSRGAVSSGRDDDRRGGRGGRGGRDQGRGGNRDGGRPPRGNDRGESREFRSDRPAPAPVPRREGLGSFAPRIEGAEVKAAPRPPREKRPQVPRAPRPPRADRPERAPRGPKGAGELRLVLKGQSQTLQGSGVAEAASTTPSSEAPQA
jgi:hypothetical protein